MCSKGRKSLNLDYRLKTFKDHSVLVLSKEIPLKLLFKQKIEQQLIDNISVSTFRGYPFFIFHLQLKRCGRPHQPTILTFNCCLHCLQKATEMYQVWFIYCSFRIQNGMAYDIIGFNMIELTLTQMWIYLATSVRYCG